MSTALLDPHARITQRYAARLAYAEGIAMAMDKVIACLLRVPVFAGLKPLQLTEISRQAERIVFRPGRVITEAGRPGAAAYLIVDGAAVCRVNQETAAAPYPVEPGSLVGELAMLIDHVYGATVVAESRVHCLKIARAALYEQMEDDPGLARHFAGALTARLTNVAIEMRKIDRALASRHDPQRADGEAGAVASQGLHPPVASSHT